MLMVTKKNATREVFDFTKIVSAVAKSAARIGKDLTDDKIERLLDEINKFLLPENKEVSVGRIHKIVELALSKVDVEICSSYAGYRNWKKDMASMMETIVVNVDKSMGERDRSNSNLNSVLFSSRRTNVSKILLKEMYMRYFLNEKERQAVKDGFIYVHDMDNRLIGTHNCCTSKLENVMNDGFWINGYFCKEPKNITNAVGVLGDITITSASAQYGGFTVADMDITLAPYCKKTFEYWCDELDNMKVPKDLIAELAKKQTLKELKDALQGFEFQINTRESSRGDYCFISVSIGRGSSFWEKEVSKMVLEVRREGHGDKIKQIVVFPKIIMVVDEKRLDDEVLDLAILTSSKALYPDYINSTKCSPMGCRSFLNDYILEDGTNMNHSRGNVGVVTLNLPMIFQEARVEGLSFAELVTYYTNMALDIHDKTYKHIGKQLAGSNPLMFTQGGFYGGNLKPTDTIASIVNKYFTASLGTTALNELTVLALGKTLLEEKSFANGTIDLIQTVINDRMNETGLYYSIYGTPKHLGL